MMVRMKHAKPRTQPVACAVSGEAASSQRPSGPHPDLAPEEIVARRMDDRVVTVFACGEIDVASGPALEQRLRDAHRETEHEMVLDLEAVTFMDSTGIHLVLNAQERAATSGYRLRLRHIPDQTRRLFNLAGLSPLAAVA